MLPSKERRQEKSAMDHRRRVRSAEELMRALSTGENWAFHTPIYGYGISKRERERERKKEGKGREEVRAVCGEIANSDRCGNTGTGTGTGTERG